MIKVFFTGRIGKDAEARTTQGGTAIASFSVASDVGFGDKKETQWFGCSIFGKRAEGGLTQYLVKGTQVAVSGGLSTREYNGKTYLEVRVDEIDLMGGKQQSAGGRGGNQPVAGQSTPTGGSGRENPPGLDDDIPF